jgi:hypothetical protein
VLYGALGALWQVGVLFGARNLVPDLPRPSAATAGLFLWLVPVGLVHALVLIAIAVAGIASLSLRRWGRRTLVAAAAVDVVLQGVVLLVALVWVAPATVGNRLAAGGSPAERASLEASAVTQWLVLWLAASLFPAVVVGYSPGAKSGRPMTLLPRRRRPPPRR